MRIITIDDESELTLNLRPLSQKPHTSCAVPFLATSTDPRGQVSQYTHDSAGNLASMRNALNQLDDTYDNTGRRTSMTVLGQCRPSWPVRHTTWPTD